jgi:acyl transferase domain-containing protein/acyl carrier protein
MALRFPGAATPQQFWRNLASGAESVTRFSERQLEEAGISARDRDNSRYIPVRGVLQGAEQFDAGFFGLTPRQAQLMDPQHRVLLECAWESLENAGYSGQEQAAPVGVFVSVGLNSYLLEVLNRSSLDFRGSEGFEAYLGNDKDFAASRISYLLNLTGPSIAVSSACSSSLTAVHLACQSLLTFETDMVLAGGVTIRLPQEQGYLFEPDGIHSPDGHTRPFDEAAQGMVDSNGAGMVVLKRYEDAVRAGDTIYAVILGSAVNNDGAAKLGYTAPSVEGQMRVLVEALAVAGVEPETIGFVETHGTGTALGDSIEIRALSETLGGPNRPRCALGAVKANVGHLDAAAGIAGLIKTALSLHHGQIPPTANFRRPNPKLGLEEGPFYVNTELLPWTSNGQPRRAGVSSFGIGGANAHVILEGAPARETAELDSGPQLMVLSAKSQGALEQAAQRLADYLEETPEIALCDVAYTLQIGRRAFDHRSALICKDREDAIRQLRGGPAEDFDSAKSATLWRLRELWLSGNGVNWADLLRTGARRRVPLPAYSFERQRYFVDPPRCVSPALGDRVPERRPQIADWFYTPSWRRREITPGLLSWRNVRVVILEDALGVGSELAGVLREQSCTVISLGPDVSGSLDALETRIRDARPDIVLHCWSLAGDAKPPALDRTQELGLYSLLAAARALGRNSSMARLVVVTDRLLEVAGEPVRMPERATLLGAVGIVPVEYPALHCSAIDGDVECFRNAPRRLLDAIANLRSAAICALRGRHLWEQSFEAAPLETLPDAEHDSQLRAGGVYLITGGTGGMGLHIAADLAKSVHAKLALVSRSGQSAPVHDEIRALEREAGDLLVLPADVANRSQMEEVLQAVRRRFGALNGVVHCAGVADYAGMIHARRREDTETVLTPKVQGTLTLLDLLRSENLDFLVLCSSIGSVLRHQKFGQVAYSAANAFLDILPAAAPLPGIRRVMTINWDDWQSVGMTAAAEVQWGEAHAVKNHRFFTEGTLRPEEGVQVFRRALAHSLPRVIVSTRDLDSLVRLDAKFADSYRASTVPGTAAFKERPELSTAYAPPQGLIQAGLAEVFSEALGITGIGIHDSFFELGGDSLAALTVVARIQDRLGVSFGAAELFERPTVATLAEQIGKAAISVIEGHAETAASPVVETYPASSAQSRLWFVDQLEGASATYNMAIAARLAGRLDVAALERSVELLTARHSALRTHFEEERGLPVQRIVPVRGPYLETVTWPGQEKDIEEAVATAAREPFSLATGPLFRARLWRMCDEEHVLLLVIHHIVSDGMSMNIAASELARFYNSYGHGGALAFESPPPQYAEYCLRERRDVETNAFDRDLDFWRRYLSHAPELQLPVSRSRGVRRSSQGSSLFFQAPSTVTQGLERLARGHNTTLFTVLLAAFEVTLWTYRGQTDLVVGTSVSTRDARSRDAIGLFVNQVVMRSDLSGAETLADGLEAVRRSVAEALARATVPFDVVVRALPVPRTPSKNPLFQVKFVFQAPTDGQLSFGALELKPMLIDRQTSKFDLLLDMERTGGELRGFLEYSSDLFDSPVMDELLARLNKTFAAFADGATQSMAEWRRKVQPPAASARKMLLGAKRQAAGGVA